ncbi:transcription factor DIVARICATA-like [Curcuma longa]|uniref:transcription factor DIVARICATA-like n=1 Tax=Curcuma longa TaxID=136217 RepID=UPI003D9EFE53
MDVLPLKDEEAARFYGPNWFVAREGGGGWSWTAEENKRFEDALAKFDGEAPDRWAKVASFVPGKTVGDVINHYRELVFDVSEIEAGRVPCPEGRRNSQWVGGGKRSGARSSGHERKKGVPWTEEEHKLFLLGLKKYGKGDWRSISRKLVITRTPTQVASHAQKYFLRLNSGSKDKRRSSIHDITTVDLPANKPPSPSRQSFATVASQASLAMVLKLPGQLPLHPDQLLNSL